MYTHKCGRKHIGKLGPELGRQWKGKVLSF